MRPRINVRTWIFPLIEEIRYVNETITVDMMLTTAPVFNDQGMNISAIPG